MQILSSSTYKLAIEPEKNYIASINVEGTELADNEDMAVALFQFYEEVLGTNFVRSSRIDLDSVQLKTADMAGVDNCFIEEEVQLSLVTYH